MNDQAQKKNRTILYVAIGCGALALLGVCAIFILPALGAMFWARSVEPVPPAPVDYTTQPPG